MRSLPPRLAACLLLCTLATARVDAATVTIRVALDTDNRAATGCTFASPDGPVAGIELIATTVVATSAAGGVVDRLERQACSGGAFGAPVVYGAGGWSAGLGNGTGGSAAVEAFIPLPLLPPGATIKAMVASSDGAGGSDATAPFLIALDSAPEPAVVPVPVSPWLLPPLALLLFALTGWLRRRYPGQSRLLATVAVLAVSGLAWAAAVICDGSVSDWNGVTAAAGDAKGDAPANADLLAVFHQQDATNLYLRIDADIRPDAASNLAPQVIAGANQTITLPGSASLAGSASDDGLPNPPGALQTTWSLVSGPSPDVVFGNPASASTTATFTAAGVYVLRLTADDGALEASGTTQVTVNDAGPRIQPIADRTIELGARLQVLIEATGGSTGGALAYSLPAAPAGAALEPAPLIDWLPGAGQLGANSFTAQVEDALGRIAATTFQVTVAHTNRPPQLAPQPNVILPVGTAFSRTLQATDPDAGDALAFALVSGPAGMTRTGATLDWPTAGKSPGDYPVTVKVSDAAGLADSRQFMVTLTPAAPGPVAKDDSYTVKVGATLVVPPAGVLGNDIYDGDGALTAARLTGPGVGTLSAFDADGGFSYQAPATPPGVALTTAKLWNAGAGSDRYRDLAADLNADGKPDLVSFDNNGGIRAWSGQDGAPLWSANPAGATDCLFNSGAGSMDQRVLADLDDSGHAALAYTTQCGREGSTWHDSIVAFDHLGTLKWVSPPLSKPHPDIRRGATPVPPGGFTPGGVAYGRGLSVARLTAGGPPVLLMRAEIPVNDGYSYYIDAANQGRYAGCRAVTGLAADENVACRATLIISGTDGSVLQTLVSRNPAATAHFGGPGALSQMPPIAMDIDGDGRVDLVSGTEVWKQNPGGGFDLAWQLNKGVNDTAVADLDGDGTAEIVHLRSSGEADVDLRGIFVYGHDGAFKRRIPLNTYWFTPLTIADVDGDRRSDIVLGADGTVYAFRDDGRPIWAYKVPPDVPSDPTLAPFYTQPAEAFAVANAAPQVYDLDGDGVAEVVFAAYSRIVILDGRTGVRELDPYWTFAHSYNDVSALMLVDMNDDGRVDIVQNAPFNFNCLNPGVAPACAGLVGPTVLRGGGSNDWLPGPKAFPNVQYRSTAIDGNARVLHDTTVSRVFRVPEQQGTVRDPRLAQATSFTYAASDGMAPSAPATVYLDIVPDNQPPVFTSTPPTSLWQRFAPTPPGGLVTNYYDLAALDPDPGDSVAFSLKSAPAWVTMSGPARIRFEPTCGSYGYPCPWGWTTVIVTATDSRGASTDQIFIVNLTTTSVTVPDVVGMAVEAAETSLVAQGLQGLRWVEAFSAQPVGTVLAQEAAAGAVVGQYDAIRLTVSKGLAPFVMPFVVGQQFAATHALIAGAGLTVDATTVFSTTIPAGEIMAQSPVAGTELLPATAPPVALTVSAGGPLAAPIASIALEPGPGPALRLAGDELQYKAVAILTDGTSADVTLTAAWASSLPGTASVDATGFAKAIAAGATTISASLDGKTAQATLNVAARTPADDTPPAATITAPANGAAVAAATQVTGTATDANFLRYELAIAAAGDATWTVIGEGTSPVSNSALGTFDPTLLVNDLYTIRLTVFDRNGNETAATTTVQLTGNRKIGAFSLTFDDLVIPMSGIPITVSRTYDSRDKARGDFGIGWRLGLRTLRLRTNRVPGTGWERVVAGINVSLVATDEHKVGVTLPDGRVEEFDMVVSPTSNVGSLDATSVTGFVPRPGTLGTLQALGNNDLLIVGGGAEDELVDDSTLDTYDPKLYRYTAADGVQMEIHKTEGVTKITDRNGNTITFGPAGIVHSAGRSVTFTRDLQGRITRITDPLGKQQTYTYDGNGDLVGHANAVGGISRYAYNRSHGLIDIQDPAGGHPARNDYDDAGRLVATTDALGNRIEFTHNLGSSQEVVRDRLGNPTLFDYDTAGNVVAKTDALGKVWTYTHDARNNPLTETDPLGRVSTKTYDARNNVLTSTDFDGNTTTRTWNARRQLLSRTDPEGRATTNVYDAGGNLTQTTNPEGGVTTHTYDAAGNRLTTTDPLGNVTRFTYDAFGNQPSITDPLDHVIPLVYDANGNLVSGTDPAGKTMQFGYDAEGRQVQTIDKLGHATYTAYSDVGNGRRIASFTESGGAVTQRSYDARGSEIGAAFPDGSTESATYDAEGRTLASTNRDGRTTTFQYDALGRRTRITHPDGTFVVMTYDAAGRVLTRTDERGNVTGHAYAPNRQTVTDALGEVTVHELDSRRRPVRTTDALGRVTTFDYDGNGKLTRTTFPDGTARTTTYNVAGQKTVETDQAGRTLQFAYDAAGRLVRVTDAVGGVTTYGYDAIGNRITETDANGHVTQLQYDAGGRLSRRVRPLGQQESFIHDANGNRLARTDFNGRTTTFTYDAANRLIAKSLPSGSVVSYAYTGGGSRAQAGGDSYAYDARGRLIAETKASGEVLAYTYDAAGNRTSLTTPQGTTQYAYDALNRLSSVVDATGTTTYVYDAVGNLAATAYPNGVTSTYAYDALNRLTQVTNTGPGGPISSYTYTLGPAGNRLKVVEAGPATTGRTVSYAYDAVYRLTQEAIDEPGTGNDQVIAYSYDAVGNRTQMNRAGVVTTYAYDANDRLLTEASGAETLTSTYDANGNLATRGNGTATDVYTYDAEDRLVYASVQSGANPGSVAYAYDADGVRTSVTAGGVTTTFLVDKNREHAQVAVETTGATRTTYTHGHQLVSQTRTGAGTRFHLADGQLSTRQLATAAGLVSDTYTYDAFGVQLASTGATVNLHRYTGERLDPNVGFYYLRARYYAQQQGRFITTDPETGNVFDPVSLHRYLYAHNDPVMKHDPSGREDVISLLAAFAIRNVMLISFGAGVVAGGTTLYYTGDPLQAGSDAVSAGFKAAFSLQLVSIGGGWALARQAVQAKVAVAAAELVEQEAVDIAGTALLQVSRALGSGASKVLTETASTVIEANLVRAMGQSVLNKAAFCTGLRLVASGPIFLQSSGIVGLFSKEAYFPAKLVMKGAIATFCGAT